MTEDTPTLTRKVSDAIHNAKFARTEQGRLKFLELAVSAQAELVRRQMLTEEESYGSTKQNLEPAQ